MATAQGAQWERGAAAEGRVLMRTAGRDPQEASKDEVYLADRRSDRVRHGLDRCWETLA